MWFNQMQKLNELYEFQLSIGEGKIDVMTHYSKKYPKANLQNWGSRRAHRTTAPHIGQGEMGEWSSTSPEMRMAAGLAMREEAGKY